MAVYRPPLSASRRYPWVTRSSSVGAGERPFARCCAELDGHRIGQVTAHLGDEKVPLVAAYVREPRSNEPKLFVTSSCGCTQSRARIAIPDEWWTRGGHSVLQELALIGSTECTDLELGDSGQLTPPQEWKTLRSARIRLRVTFVACLVSL